MVVPVQSKLSAVTPGADPMVAIAVLYERVEHVIAKIDDLSMKLDKQNAHRDEQFAELEDRVQAVERSVDRARWFLAGVAAAGGAIGGTIASFISQALGN